MITNLLVRIKKKSYKHMLSANGWVKSLGVNFGVNCKFNKEISFGSEPYLINIGNDFYCSTGIKFVTHDGSINVLRNIYPKLRHADVFGRILIGNNVFLGVNVIVLPNSIVEDNVIVGAGSIVKGHLRSGFVYAGVPAKKVCSLNEYKNKNENKITFSKTLAPDKKKEMLINNLGIHR